MTITTQEFLEGEPLTYRGYDRVERIITYCVGVGVTVRRRGRVEFEAPIAVEDNAARNLYHNLLRNSR